MSDVLHHYNATQRTTLADESRDVVRNWHLLFILVWRDLTVRYKRSFIGWFWTMLHPLLLMLIFVVVFFAFANRSLVEKAFETRGLQANVVLTALDSDVIKTYVELGLGIGILAKMAFDPKRDRSLRAIDAGHLFESSTTRLGVKRNAYLRRYAYEFIELFAPHLPRDIVERAVMGKEGSRYEL